MSAYNHEKMAKKAVRHVAEVIALLFVQPAFPQGTARWFAFNKNFIKSHFPQDSAFGSVAATGWAAAGMGSGTRRVLVNNVARLGCILFVSRPYP